MNGKQFKEHFFKVMKRSEDVLVKKGDEYSTEDNKFHNFDNATGISIHNTNVAVGWEFMVKHLQSIRDIIILFESGNIPDKITTQLLDEKFGDAINYLILIEGMMVKKLNDNQ